MFVIRELIVSTRPQHERTENGQWTGQSKNRMIHIKSNCYINLLTFLEHYLLADYTHKSNCQILLNDPLAVLKKKIFQLAYFLASNASYYIQTYWAKYITV